MLLLLCTCACATSQPCLLTPGAADPRHTLLVFMQLDTMLLAVFVSLQISLQRLAAVAAKQPSINTPYLY